MTMTFVISFSTNLITLHNFVEKSHFKIVVVQSVGDDNNGIGMGYAL